jgi:hypothetical protein
MNPEVQITQYCGGRPRYKVQSLVTNEVWYADHLSISGQTPSVHFIDDEILVEGTVQVLIDGQGIVVIVNGKPRLVETKNAEETE